ncbi:MAG: putative glutamine amidotransferase [Alphaproteobacteria bacterium MarineAlpha5_Bin9]|nr:MAG: putative glutamine amidotransferase [Alphaproteobacteria bacterium MarineAlpha5_Bin9]|tara:strand:+ start:13342 stop:14070 length:729 start_codon:yes stop_codon:yes gene_type:complete
MKKPIVGITLDNEKNGGYSKFPWYAIRENYVNSIEKYGAIALPIPHNIANINYFSKIIDALIITGGNFDIDPKLYGKKNRGSRNLKLTRTNFEIKLLKKCLIKKVPILGICGGAQLINIFFGGDLNQDIKNINNKKINHEQIKPRNQTSHSINIINNTKLHKILNKNKINVNSAHHQSIKNLGKNIIVSAYAFDSTIECIEHTKLRWCLGIQWHPEFLITKYDKLIFTNFVKVTKKIKNESS